MPAKKLKMCERGLRFYKSSNCPSFPICAAQARPETGFLSLLGAPPRGALEHTRIYTLTELSRHSEREVLKLHGVGPKSLPMLRKTLHQAGMSFVERG